MKFGLLGKGNWGRHYARLLPEFGELVVMDRKIYSSVDAVIIATPAVTHFEYIKQALEANKHILVEKPMVLSLKAAKKIKELINDKVFMVGHQYCYNDAVQELINKPLKEISLEHSMPLGKKKKELYWDVAPHLFSVVELLNFYGEIKLKFYSSKEKVRIWKFDGTPLKEPSTEPLRNEIEHFVDCVKNAKTPLTNIDHALGVIENIEKYETQYIL